MKTNSKKMKTIAAILLVGLLPAMGMAQGKLGKLKDKVTGTTGTSDVSTGNKGEDKQIELSKKGEDAYDAKKYKEAADLFQQAHDACPDCNSAKRGDYISRKNSSLEMLETEKSNANADADAEKMLQDMTEMKYKCDNVEADNGVSSATHTKYMKKFVFSKTEIVKAQENEANFTSTFNVEDNIYSRVYIDKSIINEAKSVGECNNGMPGYFIRWTFDDGTTKLPEWINVNIHNVLSGGEDGIYKWTTWQPQLSWSAADITGHSSETMYFVKYMKNLPIGSHKIKMELVYDIPEDYNNGYSDYSYTTKFGPERVLASGEFTVNVTEAGRKQLYKKVCAMYKKEIEFYNKPAVTLVSNANDLVKASTGIDWNKFTLLKVVSDFSDWTYKKNVYGVILSRSYSAGAYLLNKEDNFIYYSSVTYYQENVSSGGSSYGSTTASVEEQNIEYTRNYDSFCKECIGK